MSEKELLVEEVKGLLYAVRNISSDAKYNLAFDNLTNVVAETCKIRQILDRIDQKVIPIIKQEMEDDDIF